MSGPDVRTVVSAESHQDLEVEKCDNAGRSFIFGQDDGSCYHLKHSIGISAEVKTKETAEVVLNVIKHARWVFRGWSRLKTGGKW